MKIFKEIVGRIWALWALLFFVATMFIALIFYIPCFIIKEPAAAKWHRAVSRFWMTIYLSAVGCSLKVTGAEYFEKNKNYIIVCNHNSLIDVPVTTPFMPNANKTIAKKSFSYIPFFGWIYSAGAILVDRKNDKSRKESFDKMKSVLDKGVDMVIYPEGTRNRTAEPLKFFYDGAFTLATTTNKPIIPTLLFNTRKVLPASKIFFMLPHKLEMHFLPPQQVNGLSAKELKEKVFEIMWNYYEANK